jgi:hypothetical protein
MYTHRCYLPCTRGLNQCGESELEVEELNIGNGKSELNAQLSSSSFGQLIKPCVPELAQCNDVIRVARQIKVAYLRDIASQHVNNNKDNEVHNPI